MPRKSSLSPAQLAIIRNAPRSVPIRELAAVLGVPPTTVHRALGRVRTELDLAPPPVPRFSGALHVTAPRRKRGGSSWTLERIRAARDAQMAGDFALAVELSRATQTDDAIYVPRQNRIDAVNAIDAQLVAHDTARGQTLARKCMSSVSAPKSVISVLHRNLVDHGVGIGFIEREVTASGTIVDMRLTAWPLEFVKWSESTRCLEARTDDGQTIPIVHGDGTWVVVRKTHDYPWTEDACILPTSLIWAAHAEGLKSWASSADSHGLAKIIGELPDGMSLQQAAEDGSIGLSPEAREFLQMLIDLVSGEIGAGIRPAGAKTEFVERGGTAWQVFSELITNREKAAARVYLGTDAILGSIGGAPGVDISALFGVASTKLQGDFLAIEQALNTGLYEPWAVLNSGDNSLAPRIRYQLPDPDADRKSAEQASKRVRVLAAMAELRAQQCEVTQEIVNRLSAEYGLADPPRLASSDTAAIPLTLAPTDLAKVVRVREARASQGLAPFGDARDDMTITEFDAYLAARSAPPAPAVPA